MSYEDFEWLMGINFWGVVYGTKAFLPHLKAAGEGHVVNLSSVFGLISHPVAVGLQRRQVRRAGVHRRAAHRARHRTVRRLVHHRPSRGHQDQHRPHGPASTPALRTWPAAPEETARNFDRIARTSPEKAARQILAAVEKDKRRALIGPDAKVFDLLARLPAAVSQEVMIRASRRGRR